MSFKVIEEFENKIAKFFGSPYAVAVDCCTHGIELCLRQQNIKCITVPKRTYISVPFLANKLGIELRWKNEHWEDYYKIGGTNGGTNKYVPSKHCVQLFVFMIFQ